MTASNPMRAEAYGYLLELALATWLSRYRFPDYLDHRTHERPESCIKKLAKQTLEDRQVRCVIGANTKLWTDLGDVITAAVDFFESLCLVENHHEVSEYECVSCPKIVANATTLIKDVARIAALVEIAKNVLIEGARIQNTAGEAQFQRAIYQLIATCIKTTGRSFEGERTSQDDEKFQCVMNGFKTLLIGCMQFLNNLIVNNERRKMALWADLFETAGFLSDTPEEEDHWERRKKEPLSPDAMMHTFDQLSVRLAEMEARGAVPPPASPYEQFQRSAAREIIHDFDGAISIAFVRTECLRRWAMMDVAQRMPYIKQANELRRQQPSQPLPSQQHIEGSSEEFPAFNALSVSDPAWEIAGRREPQPVDFQPVISAETASNILQAAKDDLQCRLSALPAPARRESALHSAPAKNPPANPPKAPSPASSHPPGSPDDADTESASVVESEDSFEVVPGEDGRGLLTDVPLILGPSEIEVLPMIIMAAIVGADPAVADAPLTDTRTDWPALRCYYLISSENGRNLLRELLIFVAAWDLRDDDLFVKFMVKIIGALLVNGCMSAAYLWFKESKDLISPAQAVMVKLLTSIFRTRQAPSAGEAKTSILVRESAEQSIPRYPYLVDVDICKTLFKEFRQSIIPRTCGLIFLQGQVRSGAAEPSEFPVTLWDLERMYEGVYQYLEFLAILTEHYRWKQMMADWELSSELVTLLKELDANIPKSDHGPALQLQSLASDLASIREKLYQVDRPRNVANGSVPDSSPYQPEVPLSGAEDPPAEDPHDFEWRNLKKLAVLVLSSLIWRSRQVQDQVRAYNGIPVLVNCTTYDAYNENMREHAIMCLRFLLEGNKENQRIAQSLQDQGLPKEVLDPSMYETFMDTDGHVRLRRKDVGKEKIKGKAGQASKQVPAMGNAALEFLRVEARAMSMKLQEATSSSESTGSSPSGRPEQ